MAADTSEKNKYFRAGRTLYDALSEFGRNESVALKCQRGVQWECSLHMELCAASACNPHFVALKK
eukprot:50240-Pelagomonas_calceolata.AAC.3